ncbi:MAG TPA: sodium pump decarboxylase subunit gamma [Sedimenticola sp.]|nr:sodium pump decarboxylase subunit gamma [Sedimenticola sp.]
MPVSELMTAGVQLMLIGMGIVFAFLMVLVATMNGVSRLAKALEGGRPAAPSASGETDEVLVSVISAAIRRYRDSHK